MDYLDVCKLKTVYGDLKRKQVLQQINKLLKAQNLTHKDKNK